MLDCPSRPYVSSRYSGVSNESGVFAGSCRRTIEGVPECRLNWRTRVSLSFVVGSPVACLIGSIRQVYPHFNTLAGAS